MKQLTPIGELIEELRNMPDVLSTLGTRKLILMKCNELLEKEKQGIIQANIAGMEFIPADPEHHQEDGNNYFTDKYK